MLRRLPSAFYHTPITPHFGRSFYAPIAYRFSFDIDESSPALHITFGSQRHSAYLAEKCASWNDAAARAHINSAPLSARHFYACSFTVTSQKTYYITGASSYSLYIISLGQLMSFLSAGFSLAGQAYWLVLLSNFMQWHYTTTLASVFKNTKNNNNEHTYLLALSYFYSLSWRLLFVALSIASHL